jgi:hypothetical protein
MIDDSRRAAAGDSDPTARCEGLEDLANSKPEHPPQVAVQNGGGAFFQGTPCKHGHGVLRYLSSGQCVTCAKALAQKRTPDRRRKQDLKRRYGVTPQEFERLVQLQASVCLICGRGSAAKRRRKFFCVDHDHDSGRIRGLLCNRCNTGLGHFNDDPRLLLKAAAYFDRPSPLSVIKGGPQLSLPLSAGGRRI